MDQMFYLELPPRASQVYKGAFLPQSMGYIILLPGFLFQHTNWTYPPKLVYQNRPSRSLDID